VIFVVLIIILSQFYDVLVFLVAVRSGCMHVATANDDGFRMGIC